MAQRHRLADGCPDDDHDDRPEASRPAATDGLLVIVELIPACDTCDDLPDGVPCFDCYRRGYRDFER